MNFETATYLLFLAAAACGALAFWHSLTLGEGFAPIVRWALRLNFGFCVFAAVWGLSGYWLWRSGAALKIGSVSNGRIHDAWWLGPAACVFALSSYGLLREESAGASAWPFSRTRGSVVLIVIAGLFCLYGWTLLKARS